MLTENFSSIELGDAAAYAPYFRALPLHAADYTFTNLWGWGTHYNLEWRTAHGLCWIRQKRNDLPVERLWAPVGDWYAADWAAMPELVPGTTILRAPEPLCELLLERLPGRVAIEETPGQWEYLYTQEALSTLAGNKLHKKKNHVNGYMKAYGEDYRTLNGEIMPLVLALQDDWCKWRECEKSASLLAESDVVSLHAPALDSTRHMINGRALSLMKDRAILINTARGALVDEEALAQALRGGKLKYACLDVTDPEPPAADSPLRGIPNCIMTPHLAGLANNGKLKIGAHVADEIGRFLTGGTLVSEITQAMLATIA